MIVTVQASFTAKTYEEAVERGKKVWRDFIGDPTAELPWDSTIRVQLSHDEVKNAQGQVISNVLEGTATLSVKAPSEA